MFTFIKQISLQLLILTLYVIQTLPDAHAAEITLDTTVRDFKISHPDFEDGISGVVTGLLGSTLPANKKPVFVAANGAGAISSADTFAQWYNDVPGINLKTTIPLTLTETSAGSGIYQYSSGDFFPIDGHLFGNEGNSHNYHFTLELHSTFKYRVGQTFNFSGDDDVWVYINNQLAMDLGGVHGATNGSVNLDTLGLTVGNTYDFDFYFAERHTSQSNLNIQTAIVFDPTPVPIPAALWLFGSGLGILSAMLRIKDTGRFNFFWP